ncbi:MAG: nucleoside phosphorylase [Bacteroidetes bacterium]|nr:nucleoside phosphorylase [Bacteroidota bacterium]
MRIPDSELLINPDGSIYHLDLKPDELADTIITVGDPARVKDVSKHFDSIQYKGHHREFVTHTGLLNNKRLTVLSTGMGTDNIDIALNELDALVNIDFENRTVKEALTSLNIIRLGTSGSVNEEIEVGSILISEAAIGMDNLMHFYPLENSIQETVYLEAFASYINPYFGKIKPYFAGAGTKLLQRFEKYFPKGTTVTASGFYAPQGRRLRLEPEFADFVYTLNRFHHPHFRITNLEMETAGIYGLGKLLGHECLSVNAIIANRINQKFAHNHKKLINRMIEEALEIITTEIA